MSPRRAPATAPAWGLLGAALGALASMPLVPAAGQLTAGALIVPAAVLSAGLLLGTAVAALRDPLALLRTENILCFGLFYWLLLDLVLGQDDVGKASADSVAVGFAAIALFAAALWIGATLAAMAARGSAAKVPRSATAMAAPFLFFAALASAVLGLARVALGCGFSPSCIIDAFYQPRFSAAWQRVDAFGNFDTVMLYARYFGFLPLPLSAALVNLEGRFTWRALLTGTLGLACVALMVGEGGRKDVGTIAGASLLVWLLMKQRIALRQLVGAALLGAALVVVMQFMLVARDVGVGTALERASELQLSTTRRPIGSVDRNFRMLANIVELVPERRPYSGWLGVAYSATVWIPARFVPPEWQRRTFNLPREIGMEVGPHYSWTASAVGDLYLIGGLGAVVAGGLLFGVLARATGRLLEGPMTTERAVVYALLTMTLFLSLRALHEIFVTGLVVLAFAAFPAARAVFLRNAVPPSRR